MLLNYPDIYSKVIFLRNGKENKLPKWSTFKSHTNPRTLKYTYIKRKFSPIVSGMYVVCNYNDRYGRVGVESVTHGNCE